MHCRYSKLRSHSFGRTTTCMSFRPTKKQSQSAKKEMSQPKEIEEKTVEIKKLDKRTQDMLEKMLTKTID